MQYDKYLKLYGLSRRQAATLRALFQAASAGKPSPRWVFAPANQAAFAALIGAGLLTERARLTFAGLAVTASLPARERRPRLKAA